MDAKDPVISVVIPVYNEESSLQELYDRLIGALEEHGHPFEVVVVDDGSSDGSVPLLRQLRARDQRLRILRLSRNFGQIPALYAGFSVVRGQYVVMLDADLQNYPEDIPKLLDKLEEGYDIVSGWRTDRNDSLFRTAASKLLNRFVARATKVPVHDYGCALKAFRREVVDRMTLLTHRCRYLQADLAALGGAVAEVPVRHSERTKGKSKYGLLKLFKTAFDIVTGVTAVPLQLIGIAGWIFAMCGFAMGIRVAMLRILHGNVHQLESVIAIFFVLAGVQLIATGLMCEYVSRIYIEVQAKPFYVIQEEVE